VSGKGVNVELLFKILGNLESVGSTDRYPDSHGEYWTHCPFHTEVTPGGSFSVSERGYNCFSCGAQGSLEMLANHLGIGGLSLEEYAKAKKLPKEFLESLMIQDALYQDDHPSISMEYRGATDEFLAKRYRLYMEKGVGKDKRFRWETGSTVAGTLYGLWQLQYFLDKYGWVLVVEGESDCHTCWFYDIPAIGVPGATMWRSGSSIYFKDFKEIFIWKEPDKAGQSFVESIHNDLPDAYIIQPQKYKDISDAHIDGAPIWKMVEALKNKFRKTANVNHDITQGESPLYSVPTEAKMLACMMRMAIAELGPVMDRVSVDMFYDTKTRILFDAIHTLWTRNVAPTPSSIESFIVDVGGTLIDSIGGVQFIGQVHDLLDSVDSADYYADRISELSKRRALHNWASMVRKNSVEDDNFEKLYSNAKDTLWDIGGNLCKFRSPVVGPGDFQEKIDSLLVHPENQSAFKTGWRSMDQIWTSGKERGNITVIAGRPSMGKSTVKANLTYNLCQAGVGVFSYSPQQGFPTEIRRFQSLGSKIPYVELLHRPEWNPESDKVLIDKVSKFDQILGENWKFWLWDQRGLPFEDVAYEIARLKDGGAQIDIVTIDLLKDLNDVRTADGSLAQSFNALLGQTRTWAQKLDVHMVLLHQIGRKGVQKVKGKVARPSMDDLKDSGAWEEEADNILLLFREAHYDPSKDNDTMEIILEKQRDGVRQYVTVLRYIPEMFTLVDINQSMPLAHYLEEK